MACTRFPSDNIHIALVSYKQKNTEDSLCILYNSVENIINTVSKNIAKTFSRKNAEDFKDIQQEIRLQIYKILPRLSVLSVDGEQLIRILVSAVIFSFRSAYKKYKKATPVKVATGQAINHIFITNDWQPDENVLVEFSYEELTDPIFECNVPKKVVHYSFLKIDSQIESSIYIKQVFQQLLELVLLNNRYKHYESIIKFCLLSLLHNRQPSLLLLNTYTQTTKATFFINYTKYLIKLSLLQLYSQK